MSSATLTKFGNGRMPKTSSSLRSPAGMTLLLRIPPPFWMATSTVPSPKPPPTWFACQSSESAQRLPRLVSTRRMLGREPSSGTSLTATMFAAWAASAASTGSTTMRLHDRVGGDRVGVAPPATRTGPEPASTSTRLPSASKPQISRPTYL
jgi:hypothetical protein